MSEINIKHWQGCFAFDGYDTEKPFLAFTNKLNRNLFQTTVTALGKLLFAFWLHSKLCINKGDCFGKI